MSKTLTILCIFAFDKFSIRIRHICGNSLFAERLWSVMRIFQMTSFKSVSDPSIREWHSWNIYCNNFKIGRVIISKFQGNWNNSTNFKGEVMRLAHCWQTCYFMKNFLPPLLQSEEVCSCFWKILGKLNCNIFRQTEREMNDDSIYLQEKQFQRSSFSFSLKENRRFFEKLVCFSRKLREYYIGIFNHLLNSKKSSFSKEIEDNRKFLSCWMI